MPAHKTTEPAILSKLPGTMAYLFEELNLSNSAIERNILRLRKEKRVRIKAWQDARTPIYAKGSRPDMPRPAYDIKSQWKRSNDKRKSIRHANTVEL